MDTFLKLWVAIPETEKVASAIQLLEEPWFQQLAEADRLRLVAMTILI